MLSGILVKDVWEACDNDIESDRSRIRTNGHKNDEDGAGTSWIWPLPSHVRSFRQSGAHVWRELVEAFPDAKVLLTRRPEESWYRSYSRTIGKFMQLYKTLDLPPHIRDMADTMQVMVENTTFSGNSSDKDTAIAAYRKRTEDVRAAIPAHRLLVFDVADGWEPLCRFLEVPVPEQPFPHENKRGDFWEALGGEPGGS